MAAHDTRSGPPWQGVYGLAFTETITAASAGSFQRSRPVSAEKTAGLSPRIG